MRTNWTRTAHLVLIAVALAACDREVAPKDNAATTTNVAVTASDQCTPPELALAGGSELASQAMEEVKAHFADAYEGACDKGLLKHNPLVDPKAADQSKLFLVNAPEANAASIYLSEVDGNKMVLEYPFLTTDGKTQVPSTEELAEAIYCAVHGASQEEQEGSGRCLVD